MRSILANTLSPPSLPARVVASLTRRRDALGRLELAEEVADVGGQQVGDLQS